MSIAEAIMASLGKMMCAADLQSSRRLLNQASQDRTKTGRTPLGEVSTETIRNILRTIFSELTVPGNKTIGLTGMTYAREIAPVVIIEGLMTI